MHGNTEAGAVRKNGGCAGRSVSEGACESGAGARERSAPLGEAKRAAFLALREALGGKVVSGGEFLQATEAAAARKASRGGADPPEAAGTGPGSDGLLGCLPQGRLTEILGGRVGGSGLLMASLLGGARRRRDYVALLDLGGGFHPASFPAEDLESLLWVVCASAEEALEAGEVVARDGNFRHVLLDFRGAPPSGWRRVAASRWYRLIAALREREAVGVVFAEVPVTAASVARWQVELSPTGFGDGKSAWTWQTLPELPREALGRRLRIEALKGRGPLESHGAEAMRRHAG